MPANVTDHDLWERAKKEAAKQGQPEKWALVMHIYKQMGGDFSKAAAFAYAGEMGRLGAEIERQSGEVSKALALPAFVIPGQVPRQTQPPALDALTGMPPPRDVVAERSAFSEPVLRAEGLTRDLPMDATKAVAFQKFVTSQIQKATNEVEFRQRLMQHLHHDMREADPNVRRALMQRSLSFWKEKGTSMRLTISEQRAKGFQKSEGELEKAEPRGGNYHRRVTDPETGKHRYYYSEEDYQKRGDAHVSGAEAKAGQCAKAVKGRIGESGCSVDDLKELSGKFDADLIASTVKKLVAGGEIKHEGGKLYANVDVAKAGAVPVMQSPEMQKQKAKARRDALDAAGIKTPQQFASDEAKREAKKEADMGMEKSDLTDWLQKAGPYIGPKGGKYADPQHKIPWDEKTHGKAGSGKYEGHAKRAANADAVAADPKLHRDDMSPTAAAVFAHNEAAGAHMVASKHAEGGAKQQHMQSVQSHADAAMSKLGPKLKPADHEALYNAHMSAARGVDDSDVKAAHTSAAAFHAGELADHHGRGGDPAQAKRWAANHDSGRKAAATLFQKSMQPVDGEEMNDMQKQTMCKASGCGGTLMKGKCGKCGTMAKAESTGISSDFGGNPDSEDVVAVMEKEPESGEGEAEGDDMEKGIPGADGAPDPDEMTLGGDGDPEGANLNTSDAAAVQASQRMLQKGGLHAWLSKAEGVDDEDGEMPDPEDAPEPEEEDDLEKGGGEGSRGGKIIGHTSGGKPIYDSAKHPEHKGFSASDHRDAALAHSAAFKAAKGDEAAQAAHKAGFEAHKAAMQKENAADESAVGKTKSGKRIIAPSSKMVSEHWQASSGPYGKPGAAGTTAKLIHNHVEKHKGFSADDHKEAAAALRTKADEIAADKTKGKHQSARDDKAKLYRRVAAVHESRAAGDTTTEKSMTRTGLHDWLQKAIPGAADTSGGIDPAEDLPEGEPAEDLQPGKRVNGPMGALAGLGAETRSTDAGLATVGSTTGNPSAGDLETLSEDDPKLGEMASGEPGVVAKTPETGNVGQGTLSKSTGFIPDAADIRETQAARRALAARGATPPDLVGVGVGRSAPRATTPQAPQARVVQKGLVTYSDASDLAVEQVLQKSDDGFFQNVGNLSPLQKSEVCACGADKPVWLTTCPSCGAGSLQKSVGSGVAIRQTGPLRLRVERDLVLPNGTKRG